MSRTRNVLRVVFFILAVLLLVYVNRKPDNKTESVIEFKLKMIEKIKTDSLDSKQKAELLINETTEFMDDSSHVRKGSRYLLTLFGLWIAVELAFLILDRRSSGQSEIK